MGRPPDSGPIYLVTGAYGCVGAWVVRRLVDDGVPVTAFDLGDGPGRLPLVLGDDELRRVGRVQGDITDLGALERALDDHGVTHVIHLAALQVPFCRADPPLGARVNVVGTVNVLEAVRRRADRMGQLVYASSIAVYDEPEAPGAPATLLGQPSTIYGVYKRANEGSAAVYAADHGVSSVGLRPHTVYGPGRDQGVTAAPTAAMLAAAAGRPYRIPFGGRMQLQYAPDVAAAFVAASRADHRGAVVHNLAGHVVSMDEVVAAIEVAAPEAAGSIAADREPLPFAEQVDATSLAELLSEPVDRPLAEGVADTIARFRTLLASGRVAAPAEAPAPVRPAA